MKTIEDGNFEEIEKKVTPREFKNCQSNSLRMGMKANFELRRLAEKKGPDKERFNQLANSIEEFTMSLLDPMRRDEEWRKQFGEYVLDGILDDAIEFEQKKFFTHPVVHEEMHRKWHGRKNKFRDKLGKYWQQVLSICCLFDLAFSLILFVVFSLLKKSTKEAQAPLGMESGLIKDAQITSSSQLDSNHAACQGRLKFKAGEGKAGGWAAGRNDGSQWIQVALPTYTEITQVSTQGRNAYNQWVTKYKLQYSDDGVTFNYYHEAEQSSPKEFTGNQDRDTIVSNKLDPPIHARFVRIVPTAWYGHVSMRLELYDCKDSVADGYLLYLEIPYLKFVRDTLSYVTLLCLHYAQCLAPSTVAFSGLEWTILIFFLGRFLVECKQIWDISQLLKRQRKKDNDEGQSNCIFSMYLRDCWNKLDFASLLVYLIIFMLRISVATWTGSAMNNRALAIASYLFAFNTLCLTFRAFGHVMEQSKHVGTVQIALFSILSDIRIVFGQFIVAVLAFSFAIAKVYMAEKSFITNGYDTKGSEPQDIACKKSGISCWWAMFVHLSFSLVGLSEFHAMITVDLLSETIALVLYAVFLVLGVILLINMLIALLSHTYERTEDNALQEWAFKRAVTIEAYDDYDPIPVPLNIIYFLGKLLWQLARKTNNEDIDSTTASSVIEKSTFDELEKKYFAKHTNAFPLTDEKKLDQVLQETERNRQMVGQILTASFKAQGSDPGILRRGPEAWKVREGIRIEGHLLTCETCLTVEKHYHGARLLQQFSSEFPHFEVTILETDNIRWPGIGVVDEKYDMRHMPGWYNGSLGYHTDDGKIYHDDDYDCSVTKGPSMARRGDLIRCTVIFEKLRINQNGHRQVPVCFSLNGRNIIPEGEEYFVDTSSLYPYIGMTDGCSVLAKMCPKENKEYEVPARIAQIEKQLEETNRKLDMLLERELPRAKTWI